MNRSALAILVLSSCKGGSVESVAAPSASAVPPSSVAAPAASTAPPEIVSAAPSAPPSVDVGLAHTPPRNQKCSCADIHVGNGYPLRNGHASPPSVSELKKVISVDPTACTATVQDVMGNKQVESCSSQLFAPPHINPAG